MPRRVAPSSRAAPRRDEGDSQAGRLFVHQFTVGANPGRRLPIQGVGDRPTDRRPVSSAVAGDHDLVCHREGDRRRRVGLQGTHSLYEQVEPLHGWLSPWFVDARRHAHRRRRGERGRACLRPQRGRAAQGVLAWDAGEDQMSARGRPPTGAALLRRGVFALFMGLFARGCVSPVLLSGGTATKPARTRVFPAASRASKRYRTPSVCPPRARSLLDIRAAFWYGAVGREADLRWL